MSRVAIFGGTFDPFTVAHRDICKQAMDKLDIDKLFVIPTVVDYHRKGKKRWLTDLQRLMCIDEMLWSLGSMYNDRYTIYAKELAMKSMCENDPRLYREVIKTRRFIHTLLDFKSSMVRTDEVFYMPDISLIIGSDELRAFMTWYRWDAVLENIDYLVVVNGRDGEQLRIPPPVEIKMRGKVMQMELSDKSLYRISASKIRERMHGGGAEEYFRSVQELDAVRTTLEELGWVDVPDCGSHEPSTSQYSGGGVCKHIIGIYCGHDLIVHGDLLARRPSVHGANRFVCPFTADFAKCPRYEKKED